MLSIPLDKADTFDTKFSLDAIWVTPPACKTSDEPVDAEIVLPGIVILAPTVNVSLVAVANVLAYVVLV